MHEQRLAEIRNQWVISHTDGSASREMWDSMAPAFGEHDIPTFGEDPLLDLMSDWEMLGPEKDVLDVGCGTGVFAVALSPEVRRVVGTDFSGKMIEIAEALREDCDCNNLEFVQADWHSLDVTEMGWKGQFDLSFANMTPAVQSAETLDKLTATSREWCVLTRAVRRTDPVSDHIKGMLNIRGGVENGDNDFLSAFELLWRQGYLPHVRYKSEVWNMKKTLDEALGLYMNRMKSYRELTEKEELEVTAYVKSLLEDGFVYEDVTSTIATMAWRVDGK